MARRKFLIVNVIIFFYFRPKIVADLLTHKNDLNLTTGTFKYSDSWVLRHFHFGNQS